MNNPFEILGVSQNATDAQIREAYRVQARRLQQQIESGVNAAYAQEQMRVLDAAYDEIILSRSGGTSGSSYSTAGSYTVSSDFADIREKVRAGRLDDAQTLLDGTPTAQRSAEWYFLKGCVQQRKGWLEEATGNFAAACRLDPQNGEYKAAYEDIQNSRSGGYRTTRNNENKGGLSGCDVCTGLMCADCCCECMGGDLIRCC